MSISIESELGRRIEKSGVIAVLVIDREEDAIPLAEALLEGGVDAMELTLRTPAALGALAKIKTQLPEMLTGIGTILTTEQVDRVIAAGAAFGVAPAVNPAVIRHAGEKGLPFAPGMMTPTDLDQSIALGCRVLKYFPAESSGGLEHLGYIAAPYLHLGPLFIPLGGIGAHNMRDYLESPLVAAIGGSWLAPRNVIQARDWKTITANAKEARAIADEIHGR